MTQIHPTAIIAQGAELDTDVTVGAYCVIGANVKLGKGTKVYSHVVVDGNTSIGENNQIFPFACIGTPPQDLKYSGESSTVEIEDNNMIRESVTIQPGTKDGHLSTRVGSGNLFMANCHVAHDCIVGNHNVFANSVALAGHVEVHNHAIVGGMAGIHQFARVGSLAFIGAGAMVSQDVPPFCIAQGDRAVIRGLNLVGLRRANLSSEEIVGIKKIFKHFLSNPGNVKEKISSVPAELKTFEKVSLFCDFVASSKRGLVSTSRAKKTDDNE